MTSKGAVTMDGGAARTPSGYRGEGAARRVAELAGRGDPLPGGPSAHRIGQELRGAHPAAVAEIVQEAVPHRAQVDMMPGLSAAGVVQDIGLALEPCPECFPF